MRQGWEIRKLGEVCTILMGQSPSSDTYNDLGEGLPFFQGNADFGRIHPSVRVYCNAPIRIADVDDILISVRAPIGAINITNTKCCIGRGLAAIKNGNRIKKSFAYHALIANKDKLIALGTGSTFKSIGRIALNDLLIPVPPIDEQENIVAELDCLSGIIEKKKQQLKEYDALAQSIFYEMFGNPIDNEKGWEVKNWSMLFDTILGKMLDKKKQIETDETLPYLGNTNVQWGYFDLQDLKTMTFSNKERDKLRLKLGDILICEGGDAGRCAVWSGSSAEILFQKAIHRARIKRDDEIVPCYISFLLREIKANGGLKNYISKSTIEHLTGEKLNILPIMLPPLTLQQEFASKIEAIEKQKELIKQSIVETETLFNSRMDYYFN